MLVRNHGPFTWSTSSAKAVETARALEIIAQMAWQTLCLGPAAEAIANHLLNRHFFERTGATRITGRAQSAEL